MEGRDVIRTTFEQESEIEIPLRNNEHMMVNTYLHELFEHDHFTENKYSQLMRILPTIINQKEFISYQYFQFFS